MTEHITWHPFEMQFRKPENPPSGSNTATQAEEIVYTRKFQAPKRLLILGCGYVAQSLCRFASQLEFEVYAADDRPSFANAFVMPEAKEVLCDSFPAAIEALHLTDQDFIAIVTRGHKHDADCIRTIYASGIIPSYIGLIGSRRRVAGLFENLCSEGIPRAFLDTIHTPIGLSIGAVTTDEIAISILAELIQVRSSLSSGKKHGILEQTNMDPVFLSSLLTEEPKAISVVVGRKGSTPVKTGAIMTVNALGQSFGTIGGGCGEHEVFRLSLDVLATGKDAFVSVDMTNDFAGEEGMVCGGTMDVIIHYLPGKFSF